MREEALEESKSFESWTRARRDKNFKAFAPNLRKMIEINKQKAECFGYEGTPWNALSPPYERGLDADKITELFAPLKEATVALIDKIRGAKQVETGFLGQKWDMSQQREFGLRVARDVGYDMNAGRLDVAAHPFCCQVGANDVRITTRYSESMLFDSLLSIVHEAGHAMYEQGYPDEFIRTPLYDAPSLGVHESQSRFWEVRIAHSRPFWSHYYPILQQHFPGCFDGVDLDTFYKAANRVEPSFIRVESDEVCYNLHIIIRFEIEVAIFAGELDVEDIPAAWNERYKKYLGLDVPHDSLGCLQDVHWAHGAFGYFPTYTVGNIYCAMLVEKMEKDIAAMWDQVSNGRFEEILEWLRKNIHSKGTLLEPRDLIEQATGSPVSTEPIINYLNAKYQDIYNV